MGGKKIQGGRSLARLFGYRGGLLRESTSKWPSQAPVGGFSGVFGGTWVVVIRRIG